MIEVVQPEGAAAVSKGNAHLLPCEIEFSGDALVSAYFKPKKGEKRGLEAAFRGRALKGTALQPPTGYVGAVLQDTKQAAIADGEDRRWMHRGRLESFTVWKHDEEPNEDEPIFKVMRWASIADVLHADHSEEAAPKEEDEVVEVPPPEAKEE